MFSFAKAEDFGSSTQICFSKDASRGCIQQSWSVVPPGPPKLHKQIDPILAFVTAWYLTESTKNLPAWRSKIMAVLIVIYFIVFGLNQREKDAFTFPYFLEEVRNGKQIIAPIFVYAKRYEHPIWFYAKQEESQGRILVFTKDIEGLKTGQLICTISIAEVLELQKKFAIKEIFRQNENALYEIQESIERVARRNVARRDTALLCLPPRGYLPKNAIIYLFSKNGSQ